MATTVDKVSYPKIAAWGLLANICTEQIKDIEAEVCFFPMRVCHENECPSRANLPCGVCRSGGAGLKSMGKYKGRMDALL